MKGSRASLALVLMVWASGSPADAQSPAPGSPPPPPPVTAPTSVSRDGPVPAAAGASRIGATAANLGPIIAAGTNAAYVSAEATGHPAVFIGSDATPYGIMGTFSNHPLGFRTNNIGRLFIDTSGNVGIGTAGASYRLDVSGDANITGTYRVNGVPISATSNWTQAGNTIYYTTGNVGIGMTTPAHALEVNGTTSLGSPGSVYGFSIGGAWPGPYPTLGFNAFYTGSGYLAGVEGHGGVLQFQDGDGLFGYYNTSASVAPGAPHALTPRFTIDKDGNVGIGTTPISSVKLVVQSTVFGNDAVSGVSTSGGSGVHGTSSQGFGVRGTSTQGWGVYGTAINGTGVSGISTSGTGVQGVSNSGDGVRGVTNGSGDGVYGFSSSGYGVHGQSTTGLAGYFYGNVTVTGNVCAANFGCASDARLKQDVAPLSYGLREVLRLRPVRWQWKDTTTTQLNLGLIAQDVEPVLPELILHNVDTKGSLGLNYFGFVPVLINAMQEQQDTITALKAENASLDARIRALEQALHRLREPR